MQTNKEMGGNMRIVAKTASVAGIALLLSGCTTTPAVAEKSTFDSSKRHIVKHYKDAYYYRPNQAWSYKLNANSANFNNVASGGLLECKENDIWFLSIADRAEERKIRDRYFIGLSKFDLEDMKSDPTLIPRRDSKEFKDLMEIDRQMAEQDLIGCAGQIPANQVEKIIPMSEVVTIPSL